MIYRIHLAGWFLLLLAAKVWAGMPALLPGPKDDYVNTDLGTRLSDFGILRFQSISFFVAVFLLSALLFKWLWNWLSRDFTWAPRLTYRRALGVVFLWSLLFIIVLTMISGARELMTPGAWRKQGFTYKLAEEPKSAAAPAVPDRAAERRQHLEKLRTALWHFAATHQGRFPRQDEMSTIAAELWVIPDGFGMRYFYVPGRSAGDSADVLVHEPDLGQGSRLVLCCNGEIVTKTSAQIEDLLKQDKKP